MAGDGDPPRKPGQRPSVEEWLAQKLTFGADETSDPGPARPVVPELDTEPTPFEELVAEAPPPWEGDTDPTPITRELPVVTPKPALPLVPFRPIASETTATIPFPSTDDDGPELSDPGPYVLADPTPEPEIEDLEPPRQGGFDEVFPGLALKAPPVRDEETGALLGETSLGEEPTRSTADLEEVGDDPHEPGTQWLPHARPLRRAAEEKTEIRGFAPFPQRPDEADETPTLIVPPPMPAPLAPRTPRRETPPPAPPRPIEAPPTAGIEDPRMLTVAWWTGSAFGAALFFLVTLIVGIVVAWQYVEF